MLFFPFISLLYNNNKKVSFEHDNTNVNEYLLVLNICFVPSTNFAKPSCRYTWPNYVSMCFYDVFLLYKTLFFLEKCLFFAVVLTIKTIFPQKTSISPKKQELGHRLSIQNRKIFSYPKSYDTGCYKVRAYIIIYL